MIHEFVHLAGYGEMEAKRAQEYILTTLMRECSVEVKYDDGFAGESYAQIIIRDLERRRGVERLIALFL